MLRHEGLEGVGNTINEGHHDLIIILNYISWEVYFATGICG